MVPDLKAVIRLQELDNRIEELKKEISTLPRHIAAIEKSLDSHVKRLEANRAALAANQKERKQLEGDIQAQEQKISKLKNQMLEAKTNEQYTAFRNEIEFCEKEIRKFEDRILERMSESEPLDASMKKAEGALAAEKQQVESEKNQARGRTAEDEAQLQKLLAERKEIVAGISPKIRKDYDRLRKTRRGVAVAESVEGVCSACHLALRLQFDQELRRNDSVMFCESCGRMLDYNPPPQEFDEVGPKSEEQPESEPA